MFPPLYDAYGPLVRRAGGQEGRRVAGYIPPMVKGGQLQITDELVLLEHRVHQEASLGGRPGSRFL